VLVFLILSAAQPISGKEKVNSTTSSGELVICLDVSNSMNTKDIDPQLSRLEIAKGAMNELLNNLSGERIGITVFAGNAFVQLPITSDYTSAKVYINEIETNMLSNQGTNIAAALATSLNQFSPDQSGKTLLLVTDGEDHALGTDSVVNALQQNEINLCIVGIGSPTGGPVPIDPNRPELGYKKDGNGQLITSKPNKKLADRLAKQTDGLAVMVNEPYPSLDELLTEINQKNSRKKGTLQLEVQRNNYQLPLSLAFFNWLGWMWLNYSRLKRRKK
jgi:Ca-activated chloride channel family protein